MPNPQDIPDFIFSVVEYTAYDPPRENCRVTILKERSNIIFERGDWPHLFLDLKSMYPKAKFEIPDEIEVITLDKNFKPIGAIK